jgi:hypothetical protein
MHLPPRATEYVCVNMFDGVYIVESNETHVASKVLVTCREDESGRFPFFRLFFLWKKKNCERIRFHFYDAWTLLAMQVRRT